jgi:hypothetical protein
MLLEESEGPKKQDWTRRVFENTLILCVTWSASAYSFYFVEFYLRLVPTKTIYLQKVLVGFADIFATLLYFALVSHLKLTQSFKLLFNTLAIVSLALWFVLGSIGEDEIDVVMSGWLTLLVMAMRVSAFATFALNYNQVLEVTP